MRLLRGRARPARPRARALRAASSERARPRSRRRAGPAGRRPPARPRRCFACSVASLASSSSADLLLLALLPFEVGLLVLELRVDRRELLDDVVVGLVGLVEQLLPAGGVDRVGGVDQRFERIARVRVGEHRARWRAYVAQLGGACLGGRDRLLQSAMCSRVSSSSWSDVGERGGGLVGGLARASASCLARGVEVVAGRGARRRGAGTHRHERRQARSSEAATAVERRVRVIAAGIARRGNPGTLAAGSFDGGLELGRRGVAAPTRRTHAEVRTARIALRLLGARAAPLGRDPRAAPRQAPPGLRRRRQHHVREARRGPRARAISARSTSSRRTWRSTSRATSSTRSSGRTCRPTAAASPTASWRAAVKEYFGSYDAFRAQLTEAAMNVQGSGWGALSWEPLGRPADRRAGLRPPGQRRSGRPAAARARHVGARLLPAVQEREEGLGRRVLEPRQLARRRGALRPREVARARLTWPDRGPIAPDEQASSGPGSDSLRATTPVVLTNARRRREWPGVRDLPADPLHDRARRAVRVPVVHRFDAPRLRSDRRRRSKRRTSAASCPSTSRPSASR